MLNEGVEEMKISVIHGSQRNGNTEKTIQIVKSKLNSFGNNHFLIFIYQKIYHYFAVDVFNVLIREVSVGNFVLMLNILILFWKG